MIRGAWIALLWLIVGFGSTSWAAVQVRAEVRPAAPNDTTPFQLVVSAEGDFSGNVEAPRLPAIDGIRVLSGPSTSQSRRIINGRTTVSNVSFSYVVMATRSGVVAIPALELNVGGQLQRTQPFKLEVSSGPTRVDRADQSDPVFIELTTSQDEVYVGEPIALDVTLYTRLQTTNYAWISRPRFDPFWSESEESFTVRDQREVELGGQRYLAIPLQRTTLIPLSSGTFEIEPFVAQVEVRDRARRGFFFDRTRVVNANTRRATIEVRQLPSAGKPEAFSGAVGQFEVSASFDRDDASVDDAVALRVTVEGRGSLRSVAAPAIGAPVDLNLFDPTASEASFRRSGSGFAARRSWEWLVVPVAAGEFQLPEVRFHYFDPEAERYVEATTEPLRLAVARGDGRSDRSVAPRTLVAGQQELHFVKRLVGPALATGRPRLHQQPWFVTLLALPLLCVPLFVWVERRRASMNKDQGRVRARRAHGRAKKRLRQIGKRGEQLDAATFHEEIARTLVDYVADRVDRSGAGLTYDVADELLAGAGVEPELVRRYRGALERCDFARFVPSAGEAARRQELLDEATAIVEALERAWA